MIFLPYNEWVAGGGASWHVCEDVTDWCDQTTNLGTCDFYMNFGS
jgi:hypothetical protein